MTSDLHSGAHTGFGGPKSLERQIDRQKEVTKASKNDEHRATESRKGQMIQGRYRQRPIRVRIGRRVIITMREIVLNIDIKGRIAIRVIIVAMVRSTSY